MKTLIIHNPIAGRGNEIKLLEPFKKSGMSIIQTNYPGHATEMVMSNVNNYDLFIVAGGDGTVNEVAKAVTGTNKVLGIIPMGSGNGLVNEVGKISMKSLSNDNYKIKSIDTLFINDIPFFNVAGVGFEALVAREFVRKKKRGLITYIALTISLFMRFKPEKVIYKINGNEASQKIFTLTIANSKQFGNNATISPESLPDDGVFEVCLIKSFPKIYGPLIVLRLFLNTISQSRFYKVTSTSSFEFINENSSLWNLDGESIELEGNLRVSVNPASLRIICDNPH